MAASDVPFPPELHIRQRLAYARASAHLIENSYYPNRLQQLAALGEIATAEIALQLNSERVGHLSVIQYAFTEPLTLLSQKII